MEIVYKNDEDDEDEETIEIDDNRLKIESLKKKQREKPQRRGCKRKRRVFKRTQQRSHNRHNINTPHGGPGLVTYCIQRATGRH